MGYRRPKDVHDPNRLVKHRKEALQVATRSASLGNWDHPQNRELASETRSTKANLQTPGSLLLARHLVGVIPPVLGTFDQSMACSRSRSRSS